MTFNLTEAQGELYGASHNYAFRDAMECLWLAGQGEPNREYWELQARAFTLTDSDYFAAFMRQSAKPN